MQRTGRERAESWRRWIGRVAALALAVGGTSAAVLASNTAGAATNQTASEISTAKSAKVGTVLVAGATPVYTLKAKTTCNASCQKSQPPVLLPDGVTSVTAGPGVDASKLGTTPAASGALQITYGGKPLYWSTKDKAAGQLHGAGKNKWGTWSAVVTAKSDGKSSGGKSGGGKSTDTTAGNGGVGF